MVILILQVGPKIWLGIPKIDTTKISRTPGHLSIAASQLNSNHKPPDPMSCRSSSRLTNSLWSSKPPPTLPIPNSIANFFLSPLAARSTSKPQRCNNTSTQFSRLYASNATATAETTVLETSATQPTIAHRLHAALVLSRPPQITRDQHSFEKAFYLYQRRLNERTVTPFTRFFYFNEKTPDILDFRNQIAARKTPARDIGEYDAYGKQGWDDEVLVGSEVGDREVGMRAILKDEVVETSAVEKEKLAELEENPEEGEKQEKELVEKGVPSVSTRPMSRVTKADESGDEKSLDRALQRTLYLLVKGEDGLWKFPSVLLGKKENMRAVRYLCFV
jgi:large subunit ribosomal protein L46